jgi:hypothetical protein
MAIQVQVFSADDERRKPCEGGSGLQQDQDIDLPSG